MISNEVEYELLLQSHNEETARTLLANRYSVFGDQKSFIILHDMAKAKRRNNRKSDQSKKSQIHKRKSAATCCLAELRKEQVLPYETYEQLNRLWKEYIADTLSGIQDPVARAGRLLAADWHGAKIRVKAAKNPSLVGQHGILLWEGRATLLIVTPRRELKMLPKGGALFELGTEPPATLVGSRLICRSAERTSRKFKPHDVKCIAPLLMPDIRNL